MAKIQDKLYNRVIEGELLEITEEEKSKLGLGGIKLYKHEINISISHSGSSLTGKLYLISKNVNKYTSGSSFDISDVICGQSHIRYQGGFRPIVSLGDKMGPNMSLTWIEGSSVINMNIAFTITNDIVNPL